MVAFDESEIDGTMVGFDHRSTLCDLAHVVSPHPFLDFSYLIQFDILHSSPHFLTSLSPRPFSHTLLCFSFLLQ